MGRKFFIIAFTVAALSVLSTEAEVAKIHHEYITLDELVRMSPLILVVENSYPAVTFEKAPIDPKGKYPPYERRVLHFKVIEELANKTGLEIKGSVDVLAANSDALLAMYKNYHLKGISVSPVFTAYKSETPHVKSEDQFIVFLKVRDKKRLELSVIDAYEVLAQKEKVVKLINGKLDSCAAVPIHSKLQETKYVTRH